MYEVIFILGLVLCAHARAYERMSAFKAWEHVQHFLYDVSKT